MANYFLALRDHFALTAPSADTTSGLASGDIIGFTCARDPQTNAPFYKEIDGQYLVNLFYSNYADASAKNPEEELSIILSDYRSGFGLDVQDYNDSKRYYSSYGADLRFKDRATLSYGATSIATTGYYGSTWTSPTGGSGTSWSDVANSYDDDTTTYASYTVPASSTGNYLTLTIAATNCNRMRMWFTRETTDIRVESLDVYYGAAWHNVAGFGGVVGEYEYEDLVATPKSDSPVSVTQVRVRFNNLDAGTPRWVRVHEIDFGAATTGTILKGIDFNSEHYVAEHMALLKLNGTGNGWTDVKVDFHEAITDLKVFNVAGTDYLFIAQGVNEAYWYMTAAEAFTQSNAANPKYHFFQPVYTTALTLYGNDTNSTLRATVNPLNGGTAWSATTQVDSDLYNITGLQSMSGALYIAKEDKPYYLNSAGAVQNDLAPECESAFATTSGANSDIWLGLWYYPYGSQYLLEIGSTNTRRSPSEFCTNQSDFAGRVAAITHDGDQWLIVCLNNTTKVEVLMGRDETIDGTTSWVWHPYKELTMGNCKNAWTSTVYQKRAYISSATTGEALQYIPLPTGYGDLTSDTNRSFATGGYFETPFLHGRFKSDTKGWIKVIGTLGHSYDANIYWQIQYKKLQDSSYTNIGNMVGTATNRTHTLYLPVDGSSNNPTSTMMRFKLIGITNDTTKTPVLLNLDFRSVLYPTKKDIIWAKVRASKEMVTMNGKLVDKYAKIKACLEACRDGSYPVTMKDIDGNTIQVRFLQLPQNLPWREPVTDEKDKDREFIYNLLMLKTPTS